jgi:hypothetical protein
VQGRRSTDELPCLGSGRVAGCKLKAEYRLTIGTWHDSLVQPRVFDRDAGGRSESGQQLLIFGTESTIDMITQVEIAEGLVA